ncbi:MAG: DUF3460 family protein [Brachymonas sp.]|nr:DUF3460 family protein [Brachymonas sp.]
MSTLLSKLSNLFLKNGNYQSDTTHFIMDLKRARPELDAQQRAGRALLWDKNVNLSESADAQAARVKNKAYVYGTEPS